MATPPEVSGRAATLEGKSPDVRRTPEAGSRQTKGVSGPGRSKPSWLWQGYALEELKRSFLLQVRKPHIPALVLGGALVQYAIQGFGQKEVPAAAHLAGMFAPPPFDSFTWLKVAGGSLGPVEAAAILPIRIALLWLFVPMVLQIRPSRSTFAAASKTYVASLVVFGLFALGAVWVAPYLISLVGSAEPPPGQISPGGAGAVALLVIYYLVLLPLFVAAGVILARLVADAGAGNRLRRPHLRQGHIWVMVGLSCLIYFKSALSGSHDSVSTASFVQAFTALFLQSVIFGAIVKATAGSVSARRLTRESSGTADFTGLPQG